MVVLDQTSSFAYSEETGEAMVSERGAPRTRF